MARRRRRETAPADNSRRRFARRQWARRWVTWKWVLAVVLVVAVIGTGVWLVFFSSVLAVKSTEVSGNSYLTDQEILAQAEVPDGEPLARADLDGVRQRLSAMAAIKTVDVVRAWPDTVEISITERQPIAVVDIDGEIRGMDDEGVLFRDYPKAPAGLPTVEGTSDTSEDALAEAAEVISSLPESLAADVEHVEVTSPDQIRLALQGGATVLWGSSEESADKADVLAELLGARPDATTYNVTVPGRPAVSNDPPPDPA